MNQAIYDKLVTIAKSGKKITYGDIAPLANLDMSKEADRAEIGKILGEISEKEFNSGKPLLSAIAVTASTGFPSKGFYTLAKNLEIYDGSNDQFFANAEIKRVHNYWKNK